MKVWISALFTFAVIIVFSTVAAADAGRLTLEVDGGGLFPYVSHEDTDTFDVSPTWCLGGRIGLGVTSHMKVMAGYLYAPTEVEVDDDYTLDMTVQEVTMGFRWTFLTGSIRPLFMFEAGYAMFGFDDRIEDESGFLLQTGLGVDFTVTEHMRLGVAGYGSKIFGDSLEDAYLVKGLLTISFVY